MDVNNKIIQCVLEGSTLVIQNLKMRCDTNQAHDGQQKWTGDNNDWCWQFLLSHFIYMVVTDTDNGFQGNLRNSALSLPFKRNKAALSFRTELNSCSLSLPRGLVLIPFFFIKNKSTSSANVFWNVLWMCLETTGSVCIALHSRKFHNLLCLLKKTPPSNKHHR